MLGVLRGDSRKTEHILVEWVRGADEDDVVKLNCNVGKKEMAAALVGLE